MLNVKQNESEGAYFQYILLLEVTISIIVKLTPMRLTYSILLATTQAMPHNSTSQGYPLHSCISSLGYVNSLSYNSLLLHGKLKKIMCGIQLVSFSCEVEKWFVHQGGDTPPFFLSSQALSCRPITFLLDRQLVGVTFCYQPNQSGRPTVQLTTKRDVSYIKNDLLISLSSSLQQPPPPPLIYRLFDTTLQSSNDRKHNHHTSLDGQNC